MLSKRMCPLGVARDNDRIVSMVYHGSAGVPSWFSRGTDMRLKPRSIVFLVALSLNHHEKQLYLSWGIKILSKFCPFSVASKIILLLQINY